MLKLDKNLWIIECASTNRVLGYFYNTLYSPNNFYAYDIKSIANSCECEYLTYEKSMIRALNFEELSESQKAIHIEDLLTGAIIELINLDCYLVPLYVYERINK